MTLLLSLALSAAAADFDAALSDAGWAALTEASTKEIGPVVLQTKTIDGERCLRGKVTVDVAAPYLLDAITDMPAAIEFSRERLLASRLLGSEGDTLHYYQHLDVPNWTMVSDRYWVLAGSRRDVGSTVIFAWQRFDWRSRYPALADELARDHKGAVEPIPNYGAWSFAPTAAGTAATYTLCSNAAGSLPEWIVRAAATKNFPNTIVDVVEEGRRRAAAAPQ
jgi:hypothetical protein